MANAAAAAARRAGESIAFIGALAVDVWGRPRATTDVDFLVPKPRAAIDPLVAELGKVGFEYSGGASERHFSLWDVTTLTYVTQRRPYVLDVHTGEHPFLREAHDRSRVAEVPQFGRLRVVGPEDLIVMKLLAGRPQDMIDAGRVWRRGWELDRRYLNRWVREFRLDRRVRQMEDVARRGEV